MSAPTPRTDAAWSASFEGKQLSAGQTARALRECSQQLERELTALTAERDQLRAEVERWRSDRDCEKRLRKDAEEFRENAIARAERAEAELAADRDQLRAALALPQENCDAVYDELRGDCDELRADVVRLTARAEKLDAELATERARLDWLLLDNLTRLDNSISHRTAIDAAMKEDAK